MSIKNRSTKYIIYVMNLQSQKKTRITGLQRDANVSLFKLLNKQLSAIWDAMALM